MRQTSDADAESKSVVSDNDHVSETEETVNFLWQGTIVSEERNGES